MSTKPQQREFEVPSTMSILYSPHLPNRPPKNPIGAFLWRRRMWFEATFVFTLLEPWEKILLLIAMTLLLSLLFTGIFQYFPKHLKFLYDRGEYYWYGGDHTSGLGL